MKEMVEPELYNIFIFPFAASDIGNLVHSNWGTNVTSLTCVTQYSSAGRGCLCFAWSGPLSLLLPMDSDSRLWWRCFFLSLWLSSHGFFLCSGGLISEPLLFASAFVAAMPDFFAIWAKFIYNIYSLYPVLVKRFYCFGSRVRDVRFSRIWNIWHYSDLIADNLIWSDFCLNIG